MLDSKQKLIRIVEFTVLQLLQRNVQLGSVVEFSLLSSHWFVCGVRQRFTVLNLNFTVMYYRKFLGLLELSVLGRRHVLFVNERKHVARAVSDVASSVGESYVMGR
jgi:ribosomal protein S2